ncbi:DNA cytosine methyltransferase [Pedobacter sp. JY14-1]|uniref:DNA cytosine methyltransferase n=1 Tax=Pedobacter sp. JY14-1 TaxID=3034151 RepID=UPI0023E1E29C|nr:DNA cytosine methyltransferase [Pedobacter sp. JY14-1]
MKISSVLDENKYSFVDLFAGAGGFGLGFKLAGFSPVLSIEKDLWAANTLKKNNTSEVHQIINGDIRRYTHRNDILSLVKSSPDVIIGGPPCQGYSLAGPTKDPKDPRNSLFLYFARWVNILKPKVFVMENVTGLLHRRNANGEKVIDIIIESFAAKGYNVELWKLNSANYGVPQLRNRIFIVGNLYGKKINAPHPSHRIPLTDKNLDSLPNAITVAQAINDLPPILAGEGGPSVEYNSLPNNTYQIWARTGSQFAYNHEAMKHTKRLIGRFEMIQMGAKLTDISEDLKVRKRNGNGEISDVSYQSNYRHLKSDSISHTIPASFYSNFIHPTIPRNITSREAARIQSFPDTYIFEGQRTMISSKLLKKLGKEDLDHLSQYNQIGNAVPPLLSKAIAVHLKAFLDKNSSLAQNTAMQQLILDTH